MKKYFLGMALCGAMMMLVACENQIADKNENDNKEALQEITFSVLDFDQTLLKMGANTADTRASLSGNAITHQSAP